MDFSFQSLVQQHTSQMDRGFQQLVDAVQRSSKLSISLIRITNVTHVSFQVSLEARVTRTGPVSAAVSSMTIDLCGPAGCFGQMSLPEFKTHPLGAPIIVNNQVVNITDATALQAFIGPMMRKKEAVLCLRNGSANMAALGIGPRAIRYEKDVPMPGMRGPFVSVFSASIPMPESPAQDGMSPTRLALDRLKPNIVNVTLHISNPSALEISFGTCVFEIQNSQGEVFVEDLKGRLDIRNNAFEAAFQGIVHRRVVMREGQARLVGKRCAGAGWCDETIKSINVSLSGINKVLRVLVAQHHNEGSSSIGEDDKLYDIEESDDVAGLTRWTSKIFRRRKV